MNILITGGAGFIGTNLARNFVKKRKKVIIVDNLSAGKKENIPSGVKFYKIDIRSPAIFKILKKEKPEFIFHFAAQQDVRKSVKDPFFDVKVNILGSLNILESLLRLGAGFYLKKFKKFIFASTGGAIYGDATLLPTPENYPEFPLSPYGIDKLATEKYLNYYYQNFGLPFVALRLSNIYGPYQNFEGEAGVVAIFISKMLQKKQPIIYGDGKQTRDFLYVEDLIRASILAMRKGILGIYNIGTGIETDINTLFEKIKKFTNSQAKKIYRPSRKGEQKRSCLDIKKAKKELGWWPKYSLDEGLKKTIFWFQKKLCKN